ncbi:DDHD domain-containing protein [Ilyonectria robusta]|uniref:DDHD domain-containing protein n=1 Tax=Ilyonectria robusta TaxID=1079257 RepID=UPI001E8E206A|nr:DDHD domain-containing protein [Ilyonectria robusta]KAH8700015.1 DDHD domain-containing protein [Ilyonectria robusta]
MAPGQSEKKVEQSYLSSAVNSINPWASSRSTTPTQPNKPEQSHPAASANPDDHSTTHLYGQSFKTYPPDCPPLKVQWFHAVDVPKRKPQLGSSSRSPAQPPQPPTQPKKFSPFSVSDSRTLESEYQGLLEATENTQPTGTGDTRLPSRKRKVDAYSLSSGSSPTATIPSKTVHVPVNEDFLFDVEIGGRELAPVYWLGPVYEVRRGTWFYQDGSNLRPCEENLAAQLEEGYLKMKPWLYPVRDRSPSGAKKVTPKGSRENFRATITSSSAVTFNPITSSTTTAQNQAPLQPQTHRLFGTYMNSVATYQDSTTAWLTSDSMLSWVTSSVYERFAGGGYMSGVKLIRGYAEPSKNKEKEKDKEDDGKAPSTTSEDGNGLDERQQRMLKRRSAPPTTRPSHDGSSQTSQSVAGDSDPRELKLQRQLSSLIESDGMSKARTEEEIRRREEQEIQDDYNAQAGETQGREIEHLVLVTHGIGQLLSLRMESVNFVHDVNVLRKTIKSVYTNSADLKALNSELGTGPGNCRVQVLPVCWRHLLDFPKKREKRGEHDLGEVVGDEDDYPSLEDITIEGMAFARSLISDLALDVLLYQSSYREQISKIVLKECNRIFKLFKERNPEFKGKVHLLGHSLGSAILFDVLCQQKERVDEQKATSRFWSPQERHEASAKNAELDLDFDVGDFFCLGSPVGLFQMLKGRTIAARQPLQAARFEELLNAEPVEDAFRSSALAPGDSQVSPVTGLSTSISSPKVEQLFNIFHPSDPISYRLEPLISPSMSTLKPQLLPYTKKGIFGNVAPQGLTGIGAKVGQSVSGLWSSLSAGIASNILNRSLGLSSDEVARITANAAHGDSTDPANPGGDVAADVSKLGEKADARKKQLADSATLESGSGASGHSPTLIDDELETLFSRFQQRRADIGKDGETPRTQEEDRKARKLRAEENKVRALNRNGRVDYSIQESVLDFNPINTIASHMGYWADEDVNHFMLSQLLSYRSGRRKET